MKKDNTVYLKQILDFIADIEEYVADASFENFEIDFKTQDAVLRKFELIGEAAKKLDNEFIGSHPDFPIKQAIAVRNKLIHEYEEIDLKIIWDTVKNDLSKVKDSIQAILH